MSNFPNFLRILAGLVFVFLIPPFQSPDEPAHFFRAWQISEGIWMPTPTADGRHGGQVPQGIDSLDRQFQFLKNNYNAKISFKYLLSGGKIPLSLQNRVFRDFPNTAIYAPTAYLAPAFVFFITRPFHLPPLILLWLGRLANFMLWLALIHLAIKALPCHKLALGLLAFLPAGVVLATSLNADVITNGLCFWLAASLWNRNDNPAHLFPKIWWIWLLVGLLIAVNKIIYLPVIGMFWIPGNLHSRNAWIQFVLLSTLCFMAALAWSIWANKAFLPYGRYAEHFREAATLNEGVEPKAQIEFILQHPLYFLKIAASSAAESLPSATAHILGKFGWEKNYLPAPVLAILGIGIFLGLFTGGPPVNLRGRLWALGLIFTTTILFAATMYAIWNPVGAAQITNWQGRYFTPILPMAIAVFGGLLPPKTAFYHHLPGVLGWIWVSGHITMAASIVLRYYLA